MFAAFTPLRVPINSLLQLVLREFSPVQGRREMREGKKEKDTLENFTAKKSEALSYSLPSYNFLTSTFLFILSTWRVELFPLLCPLVIRVARFQLLLREGLVFCFRL